MKAVSVTKCCGGRGSHSCICRFASLECQQRTGTARAAAEAQITITLRGPVPQLPLCGTEVAVFCLNCALTAWNTLRTGIALYCPPTPALTPAAQPSSASTPASAMAKLAAVWLGQGLQQFLRTESETADSARFKLETPQKLCTRRRGEKGLYHVHIPWVCKNSGSAKAQIYCTGS